MADAIIRYTHTVGNNVDFAGAPDIQLVFVGREIYAKGAAVIKVHDPDKKYRRFTLRASMTGAEYKALYDLVAATTTYSATYPRLTHVILDGSNKWENVLVMVQTPVDAKFLTNGKWAVTMVCLERSA